MASGRKYPIDFRKAEVTYIMQRWSANESCSLVGIGSVGKSNLLMHISNPNVQAHYIPNFQPERFKAITIDPNMLGPLPAEGADNEQIRCWAGYELMMHRLFMAFYPFDMLSTDEARRFYETYQALQDGTNPLYAYMGLRYFELGLDFLMRRDVQIVFMFDEFEEMLKHLPTKFFQTLRGLRDAHKSQLSFLTFTRLPLPALVERLEISPLDIEPFVELFTDNLYYVGPYNEVDARNMIDELMKRNNKPYPTPVIDFLLHTTGRYAGLLRAGFHLIETLDLQTITPANYEKLTTVLASRQPVRTECRTIWTSLSQAEMYVLKAVARLTTYNITAETEQAVTMLVQKRLIHVDKAQNTLNIEPPVFRSFVATNPDVD